MYIKNYDGLMCWINKDHVSYMYPTRLPTNLKSDTMENVTCITLINREYVFTKHTVEYLVERLQEENGC